MTLPSPPPLNHPDEIDQIVTLARQAGDISLRYFQKVNPKFKQDKTFVTQVDLEIEQFLVRKIRSIYPAHNIIGEEKTNQTDNNLSTPTWVIDPIDGTTAFVQGLPGWGISIGLLDHGQPSFGLFYMPLLDDVTYTTGQGYIFGGGRIWHQSVRENWGQKGFLAVNASVHCDYHIHTQRTRALGSIGANLIYTARGTAVGAFIPKAYIWDLVPGAAIINKLGGELRYLNGEPINYMDLLRAEMIPSPIIAAHPNMQPRLREVIEKKPPVN